VNRGAAAYAAYIEGLPQQVKARYRVEVTIPGERFQVGMELTLRQPNRFSLRVVRPGQGTLFTARSDGGHRFELDLGGGSLPDPRAPAYLARDLHRIFFRDCPEKTPVKPFRDAFLADCSFRSQEPMIEGWFGPDPPDDQLMAVVADSGRLLQKCFYRYREAMACVDYSDFARVDGHWFARAIEVQHQVLPYTLSFELLAVEVAPPQGP